MQDHQLDRLLSAASKPTPNVGFEQRLLTKISPSSKNVITFPQRKAASPWLIGLPLAASLVLGVWLGSSINFLNTDNILVSQTEDGTTSNGFEDVVALIEDTVS